MAQKAAIRVAPVSRNVFVGVELFHRLLRLFQLEFGAFPSLVRCRVDLLRKFLDTILLMIDIKRLFFYFRLDRSKVLLERRIAEESDAITRLAVLALKERVLALFGAKMTWRAVTRRTLLVFPPSEMKKPPVPSAQGVRWAQMGKTKSSGKRFADI